MVTDTHYRRFAEEPLIEALADTPVVLIHGPRQCGKTTLARVVGQSRDYAYFCLDEAVKQAREFRTTWQSELARYVVHGVLHLRGYDDLAPAPRRRMKREENRLVRKLALHFGLSQALKTIFLIKYSQGRMILLANSY